MTRPFLFVEMSRCIWLKACLRASEDERARSEQADVGPRVDRHIGANRVCGRWLVADRRCRPGAPLPTAMAHDGGTIARGTWGVAMAVCASWCAADAWARVDADTVLLGATTMMEGLVHAQTATCSSQERSAGRSLFAPPLRRLQTKLLLDRKGRTASANASLVVEATAIRAVSLLTWRVADDQV